MNFVDPQDNVNHPILDQVVRKEEVVQKAEAKSDSSVKKMPEYRQEVSML